MSWLAAFTLSLLLGYASATSCGSATCTTKPECCGQFGCCSSASLQFYTKLTSQLSGTCKTDTLTLYSSCITASLQCIDGGLDINSPTCKSMVATCFQTRCQSSATAVSCQLTAHYLLSSTPIRQQPCVPRSCIANRQAKAFTQSLFSVLCEVSSRIAPISFCAVTDLSMQCPTVTVACTSQSSCQASYSTGSGHTPPPVTTAPAPLCHAPSGSVNCAASGKSSGNTSCCVVAGYTLGCCAPDVATFLADLFGGLSSTCAGDLVSEQRSCLTKLSSCLTTAQGLLRSNGGKIPLGSLGMLAKCNVLDECTSAAKQTATCTQPKEQACNMYTTASAPSPLLSFVSKALTVNGAGICLPQSCSSSASLNKISQLFYTAVCFPVCQLTAGTTYLGQRLSNCPLTSVSARCPSSSGMYNTSSSMAQNQCRVYNISIGSFTGGGSSTGGHSGHSSPTHAYPRTWPVQSVTFRPEGTGAANQHSSTTPGKTAHSSKHTSLVLIAVGGVAGILLIALVTIGVIYVYRRQRSPARSVVAYSGLDDDEDA